MRKFILRFLLFCVILIAGVGYYAWQIEPYSYRIVHLSNSRGLGFEVLNQAQISYLEEGYTTQQTASDNKSKNNQATTSNSSAKLPDASNFQDDDIELFKQPHLKIIQITDTHIKESYNAKHLSKIVDAINQQQPDIVVFTGDLYDFYDKYPDKDNAITFLKSIKAKLAKLAIWGNRDYYLPAKKVYPQIIKAGGFKLLTNENCIVTLANKQRILITGLDDGIFGDPKIPQETKGKFTYRLLLLHEPEYIEMFSSHNYDLALSGHSHGGQVSIPGLNKLIDLAIAYTNHDIDYKRGLFNINPQGLQQLYVNPGLGTTLLPLRLNVPPEITVFHFVVK